MRHLLSYFIPLKKLETSSKYNHTIRVNEHYGCHTLLVNGSTQSGGYVAWLWKQAFRAFHITDNLPIRSIAVLGVAGGTVIQMFHTLYPNAKIIGVDIDPMMIEIGKKYFGLSAIADFSAFAMDAQKFVSPIVTKKSMFDCVVVDMFIGREIPSFLEKIEFWENIRRIIKPQGCLIVNYLQEKEYQEKSNSIASLLKEIGSDIKDYRIKRNRFFFASIV